MAFSNPVLKPKAQYEALNFFENNPVQSRMDTPDSRIVNIELKGWVSSTIMVFKITAKADTTFEITAAPTPPNAPDPKTINIAVRDQQGNMLEWYTYHTVDVGNANNSRTDWTITFDIKANNQSTGKWVFRKGGSEPNF